MADYIDRDALIGRAISEKRFVIRREDALSEERAEIVLKTVYKDFADFVLSIPAADVEPVVHCGCCKFYNKPRLGWCEVHLDCEKPDDFCSYGKYVTNGGADHAPD